MQDERKIEKETSAQILTEEDGRQAVYHIVANPVAGKNKAMKNLKAVENVFRSYHLPYEVHLTSGAKDATRIVRELTERGENNIVSFGGDGTLHEVLNGIADPAVCNLGIIPVGTGNDFAEKLGIPLNPAKAAFVILSKRAKETDYFTVGGVRCMNVGGLGMDVDVLERCERGKMKGKLKYLASLVQSLFKFKGYQVEIETDGIKETRDVLIAAACNGGFFGGGIKICPVADVSDGKLDAIIVDCIGGKWKIIHAFTYLLRGKVLSYPAAKHILCDKITFRTKNPCAVQLDGELYTNLPFEATIGKGLKIFRP